MTELLDYLSRHFLTEPQLLTAAALDATTLHALQARRMTPMPSYRLRLAVHCDSFFGPHTGQHVLHCYARGTPAWLHAVRNLPDEAAAFALFATRHQARLRALDAHAQVDLADAWRSFLDGIYGLCTRSGLPEEIAAKEWAAGVIEALTAAGDAAPDPDRPRATGMTAMHAATPASILTTPRARLRAAVDLLDAASSPFAPHERARSSRARLVEQVRQRYALE